MIFIVRDLFIEAVGAEIQLALGALPTGPTDFSDGAIGASTRDIRMLHSRHRIVNYLPINKELLIKLMSIKNIFKQLTLKS